MKALPGYLTPVQLAVRWQMSEGTLCNWRMDGRGPKFVKRFGRVWYDLSSVVKFERANGLAK